jgi:gas vesicle protein
MNRDNLISFGIGLGTGILIGGILGVLFAPKSGIETRQIIKSKAAELKDKAKDLPADIRAKLNKAKISDIKPK